MRGRSYMGPLISLMSLPIKHYIHALVARQGTQRAFAEGAGCFVWFWLACAINMNRARAREAAGQFHQSGGGTPIATAAGKRDGG